MCGRESEIQISDRMQKSATVGSSTGCSRRNIRARASFFFYIYGMQFTQENKFYNHQVLKKCLCTLGKNKNQEIKEINTLAKVNKK